MFSPMKNTPWWTSDRAAEKKTQEGASWDLRNLHGCQMKVEAGRFKKKSRSRSEYACTRDRIDSRHLLV
jgi:hypothetical protein